MDTHLKLEKLHKLIVQDKKEPKTVINTPQAQLLPFGKDMSKKPPELVPVGKFSNAFEKALNMAIYKMWLKKTTSKPKIDPEKVFEKNLF